MNLGAWQRGRKGSGGLGRMDLRHARRRRARVVHGACEQQQTESLQGHPALGGLGSLFPKRFVEQPQGLNPSPRSYAVPRGRSPVSRGAGRSSKVMPQPCGVLGVGRGKQKPA